MAFATLIQTWIDGYEEDAALAVTATFEAHSEVGRSAAGRFVKTTVRTDLAGQQFGAWTAIAADRGAHGAERWSCVCACGKVGVVERKRLLAGRSASCGCERQANKLRSSTGHKGSKEPLYRTWIAMRQRCENPNHKAYPSYGGRGIALCAEWLAYPAFRDWAFKSGYVAGLTIERCDNDRGYEPGNCTWIPANLQAQNRRVVPKSPDGVPWFRVAQDHGLSRKTYSGRVALGWDHQSAATLPRFTRKSKVLQCS